MKTLKEITLLSAMALSPIGLTVAATATPAESAASAAESAASAASSADAAKKAAEAAAAKFDLPVNIIKGDKIRLRSNMYNLERVEGTESTRTTAPAHTCLRVTRLNDNGGITVAVENGTGLFSGLCESRESPVVPTFVKAGDVYKISGEQLKNASYSRYGWIYGPMFVPFKYFPHDKSFESSQSLGMYLGFRTSWFESHGLSLVASAGLATMKTSQIVDDPNNPGTKTTKENTVAGYTVASGVLFDLTTDAKPFVAGLLIGRDYVGSNSALTYAHDGKTWVALQIGWVQ